MICVNVNFQGESFVKSYSFWKSDSGEMQINSYKNK